MSNKWVLPMRILPALALSLTLSLPACANACGGPFWACSVESGRYHIALPDEGKPTATIIYLHGLNGSGSGPVRGNMAREATRRGYAFIAPSGFHPDAELPRNWAVQADNFVYNGDDKAFLRDVLDDAATHHGVPTDKVLLSGFSRGASMTWDIACKTPDFATAYAPVAGAFWVTLPEECNGPVKMLHVHGWSDRTIPLEGRRLFFPEKDVRQGDLFASLKILRETNGCDARQPERTRIIGDWWWRHWTDCRAGRIDLAIHPGGHGLPKGWAVMALDWFAERLAER